MMSSFFITALFSLPFLVAAHYCLSTGIILTHSKHVASSTLSKSNSDLLRSFMMCIGVICVGISAVLIGTWAFDISLTIYNDPAFWAVSSSFWCVAWHSYRLNKQFAYKVQPRKTDHSYRVELNSVSQGVPLQIRSQSKDGSNGVARTHR